MSFFTVLAAASAVSFSAHASATAAAAAVEIAPSGVVVGKPYSAVRKAASAAGFAEGASGCLFTPDRAAAKSPATGSLRIYTGRRVCTPDAPVRSVEYRRRYATGSLSEDAALTALSRKIGAEPACQSPVPPRGECAWNDPKRFPKTAAIIARLSGSELTVTQESVDDLSKTNSLKRNFDPLFDPRLPVSAIDPRAPGGVKLGMTVGEISRQFEEAGFQPVEAPNAGDASCHWRFQRRHELDIEVALRAREKGGRLEACKTDSLIVGVDYRKRDMRLKETKNALSAIEAVDKWRRALKPADEQGICKGTAGTPPPLALSCNFIAPSAAPEARTARLKYQRTPQTGAVEIQAYLLAAN